MGLVNPSNFVPKHNPLTNNDILKLRSWIQKTEKLLIITGAGVSTESGLPDYRSEAVGLYSKNRNFKPTNYSEFVRDETVRKRYWLRNFLGWERLSNINPNATHNSIRNLEIAGRLLTLVTQNVDGLDKKAGTSRVIELHGTAHRVVCMQCDYSVLRADFQHIIAKNNPGIKVTDLDLRPDGDVQIDEEQYSSFCLPDCKSCGGCLKPDIVFFGGNVPLFRMSKVRGLASECDSLLILGTSLSTFSSYRIALQVAERGRKIAIVNIGKTRGDHLAELKIETRCGLILPVVVQD